MASARSSFFLWQPIITMPTEKLHFKKSRPADELNSKWGTHKWHGWSIEGRLLEAISKKEGFKTKTTEYSPHTHKVYLFGHEIVRLSSLPTSDILYVTFPPFTEKKDIDLYRLRLRQLGLRCRLYNKKTHIFFGEISYPLEPGQVFNIPGEHRKSCLPTAIQPVFAAPAYKIPQQLQLELVVKEDKSYAVMSEKKVIPLSSYCGFDIELEMWKDLTSDMSYFGLVATQQPLHPDGLRRPGDQQYRIVHAISTLDYDRDTSIERKVVEYLQEQLHRKLDEYHSNGLHNDRSTQYR
jgi:hypothetical protein